jgi:hypothetical protein
MSHKSTHIENVQWTSTGEPCRKTSNQHWSTNDFWQVFSRGWSSILKLTVSWRQQYKSSHKLESSSRLEVQRSKNIGDTLKKPSRQSYWTVLLTWTLQSKKTSTTWTRSKFVYDFTLAFFGIQWVVEIISFVILCCSQVLDSVSKQLCLLEDPWKF